MARQVFKFEGGRELERSLSEFKKSVAKATARRALRTAADPILSAYKAMTKVASGTLERLEVVGTRLTRRQSQLNRKNMSRSGVEVHIGTADPAGIQEEFGNARQRANPSLRPAWDSEGGQKAVDRIAKELWVEIDKTAAREARKAQRLARKKARG